MNIKYKIDFSKKKIYFFIVIFVDFYVNFTRFLATRIWIIEPIRIHNIDEVFNNTYDLFLGFFVVLC